MAASNIQDQLTSKLAELTALQAQPPVAVLPLRVTEEIKSTLSIDSIEDMLSKLIDSKLASMFEAAKPIPEVIPVKEITILDALGNILTGAELKWLQDAKVISRIPEFVLTEEGQELTQKFFRSFRKDYEK